MIKITSSEANKLLRRLNDELTALSVKETSSSSFLAALGEDPESVRPQYDFKETQAKRTELELKIAKVKHAINLFNVNTVIPGFDITIDTALVLMPQMTLRCNRLQSMKSVLPKARERAGYGKNSMLVDYRYANYDIAEAETEYEKQYDALSRLQTALDLVNSTCILEVDV